MKKRGSRWGFQFFEIVLRTGGLRPAYAFLYLVCLHYLLFDLPARHGAMAYIRRAFPTTGPVKRLWLVYQLFIQQGKNLIDRYVHQANPNLFELKECGFEKIESLRSDPSKGFILLTAHTGNWQVAMTVLKRLNRTVHLLMRPEDNPASEESLKIQQADEGVKIISVNGPMGGMVETMNALGQGDVVSIMGDRHYDSRSVSVQFFGESARFPCAAFLIAATARCPVVTLFSSKVGTRDYSVDLVDCFEPQWKKGLSKEEQLQQWTQQFAGTLETYLKERPLQCFLFHDVWKNIP